ncbi:MAG TPA: choice-of-anchor I family protein [Burkholderiaceae bacterium]|mgnify:FL=1|nr:choice-of-anchor I family protein [Burkholderiaceae bacterium]
MPLPFTLRPLLRACALAFTVSALSTAAVAHPQTAAVQISRVWQYAHALGGVAGQKAEIVAYDDRTDTLWVAGVVGVDVLDRSTGQLVAHIDVTNLGAVNSVAIHDGLAALAIENGIDRSLPGFVVFYETRTRAQSGQPVVVGSLPDMLTFTPNGKRVLVASEATPNAGSQVDPAGSVSIVEVKSRSVKTLPIDPAIVGYDTLRQFPALGNGTTRPNMTPYGPEPEYIAVDKEGRYAYVGLQEANGIAVLNLKTDSFEKIYSLGLKDFSLTGNEIDPHDQENGSGVPGRIELRPAAVKGLYQPDTIAAYSHKDRTYLVMANEGDSREDSADERRGSAGSGAAELVPEGNDLSRLTLSNVDSAAGALVTFGGHSFSIRDAAGTIVFDSGSQLDREAITRGIYDDGRSDNKGVEPEGVALLHIEGRVLAFIGLERTLKSAIAVYDITNPRDARFIDMIVSDGVLNDVSPEGLKAFRVGKRYFVAAAHEVSDTTSLFEIDLSKGRDRDHHSDDH